MIQSFEIISKKSKKEIYYKYADAMMLLCLRYTGNKQDAEEVMHNGFLKVFEKKNDFKAKHKNSFSAWLKKIMINECLMYLRKDNSFNLIPFDEVGFELQSKIFNNKLETDDLLIILKELPVGYRTVFNMYVIEGYKHSEISKKLGISESTSRTQLLKSRKKLQKIIIENNMYYET